MSGSGGCPLGAAGVLVGAARPVRVTGRYRDQRPWGIYRCPRARVPLALMGFHMMVGFLGVLGSIVNACLLLDLLAHHAAVLAADFDEVAWPAVRLVE